MSNKNIFLIGMPSSGKSTLGRALAKALNFQFVDMDEIIERQEGKTVQLIFQEKGEAYFRKVESQVLKEIPLDSQLVIATGGGVPCFFDNMAYIKTNGKSIFIDVKPEALFQRINQAKTNHRPLIDKTDPNELLKNLQTRYEHRLPFYQQTDWTIVNPIDIEDLVGKLVES